MTTVVNRSSLSGEALELVQSVLVSFRHMDEVIRFSTNLSPSLSLIREVAHEDGTRDILASRRADSWVLSFTSGPDGRILQATIWDRHPTSEELASARL